ncbi:hypothetical protein ACFV4P_03175 [Kitasatospora sp. NPDC059795]|uniref:hypothetical protein n=1 Tax=Kitasatospora sp. NPDC059795 TaxID=3346949 RepID=UPI00364B5A1A
MRIQNALVTVVLALLGILAVVGGAAADNLDASDSQDFDVPIPPGSYIEVPQGGIVGHQLQRHG